MLDFFCVGSRSVLLFGGCVCSCRVKLLACWFVVCGVCVVRFINLRGVGVFICLLGSVLYWVLLFVWCVCLFAWV